MVGGSQRNLHSLSHHLEIQKALKTASIFLYLWQIHLAAKPALSDMGPLVVFSIPFRDCSWVTW